MPDRAYQFLLFSLFLFFIFYSPALSSIFRIRWLE